MAAIATVINTFFNSVPGIEFTVGIVVAIVVLRLFDIGRRLANVRQQAVGQISTGSPAHSTKLSGYAPETIGLLVCLGFAGALRIRGSIDLTFVTADPHMAALAEVAREWPILLTADTLLSLQAMLRVCVLASSVLRRGGPSLLTQEAAVISLGAVLGRVVLVARSDVYMLDGPLGGHLPTACEIMSLALLLILCRGIHLSNMMESALTLAIAAWIASSNRLNLANDALTDGLYIFAIVSELLAAFAYLCRAFCVDIKANGSNTDSVALRFAHIIMPVQACLSAYFFVRAFEVTPQLIAAGRPFEILQWGCFAQVAAYAGAALLHWAQSVEESQGSVNCIPQHAAVAKA